MRCLQGDPPLGLFGVACGATGSSREASVGNQNKTKGLSLGRVPTKPSPRAAPCAGRLAREDSPLTRPCWGSPRSTCPHSHGPEPAPWVPATPCHRPNLLPHLPSPEGLPEALGLLEAPLGLFGARLLSRPNAFGAESSGCALGSSGKHKEFSKA